MGSYIVRNQTYGSFHDGAPVRVEGEGGHWSFRGHCINIDTGAEWLDVFGGETGRETIRAFRPERVQPVPVKRKRGLSLEDLI